MNVYFSFIIRLYYNEFQDSSIIDNIFLLVNLMSRGNVFKLSSNNVLGGNHDYQNDDINDIKNSLKLLKAKKNQKINS